MNRATKTLSPFYLLSFILALVGLTVVAFPATPLFAQDTAQLSPDAQAIAQGINQQRANNGLPALNIHPLLDQAAQDHVNDMIANHFYGHTGSDGSYARQRVDRVGYNSGGWVSENWVTSSSPESALNWWMNDWIHRVNILNPNWRDLGVGVGTDPNGGTIFVTDFTAGSNGEIPADVGPVDNGNVTNEPLSVPTGGIDYTIQPGDTLLAIAYRYGLDWVVIAESNKLTEDTLLQIGQTIHLPGVESVGGPVAEEDNDQAKSEETVEAAATDSNAEDKSSDASKTKSENQTGNGFTRLYTVQPGNTLVDIAAIYDITWEELAAANNLADDSTLKIGQELRIPGEIQVAASSSTEEPSPEEKSASDNEASAKNEADTAKAANADIPEYYELQEGDTIISIAVNYHLDWEDILSMNNIGEDTLLQLGQKIRLR
ncbi:hypothetical protein BH10CHL1_BH10CHL1_15800 [soil metagenome]